MFNRFVEIQKLKIALTSSCCLSCRHCGIDKGLGAVVPVNDARAAVRALLNSHGLKKRLELYGGEPFLEFGLMREIAAYARGLAGSLGKELSLSVASNGLLLKPEHLEFLRSSGASLSLSFSGLKVSHDRSRVFSGGRGSFAAVKAALPAVFAALDRGDVVALDCVHPADAGRVSAEFAALVKLGFRVINVECVHGPAWPAASLDAFRRGLGRIRRQVEAGIETGTFVYPEPLLELARSADAPPSALACRFYRDLELYPDGSYSFYPFAFINYRRDIGKVRIGTAAKGLSRRWAGCVPDGPRCRGCEASYYRLPGLSEGSFAYRLREEAFRELLAGVLKKALRPGPYREYAAGLFRLLARHYSAGRVHAAR